MKVFYFCFIDYAKAFYYVDHNKLENSQRWEYQATLPDSWEIRMQVKKQQLDPDMEQWTDSKLEKEYNMEYMERILSSCLFNFCAEYIMWHASLDESQAGIKIAMRNINNFGYADDTTLIAESEEDEGERGKWKKLA